MKNPFSKKSMLFFLLLSISFVSLMAQPPEPPDGQRPMGPPSGGMHKGGKPGKPGGGMQSANPSVTAKAVIFFAKGDTMLMGSSLESQEEDESVIRVKDGAKLTGKNLTINKSDGEASNEEESNFYGLNATVAAEKGSSIVLTNCVITSNADGANGAFAFGKGASVTLNGGSIHSTESSSRGLDATYGGSVTGNDLTIDTEGAHCADLATDRGEGTIRANRVRGTTKGEGSPGIYSTGDIAATDCHFEAFGSEAAVIEGKNSITLLRDTLIGHNSCGAMLYQSFSGDASTGTSVFTMKECLLEAKSGPIFYSTNTSAVVNMEKSTLVGSTGILLRAAANRRWGCTGQNGAQVTLNATNQELQGSIEADSLSALTLNFGKGTQFCGSINADNKAKAVTLNVSSGCEISLSADCNIDVLSLADGGKFIASAGHNIFYNPSKSPTLGGKTLQLSGGGKVMPVRGK